MKFKNLFYTALSCIFIVSLLTHAGQITASDVREYEIKAKCGINDQTERPVIPKPTIQKMSECRAWRARCLSALDAYLKHPNDKLADHIIDKLECFEF
jgi:hypothetical protein